MVVVGDIVKPNREKWLLEVWLFPAAGIMLRGWVISPLYLSKSLLACYTVQASSVVLCRLRRVSG